MFFGRELFDSFALRSVFLLASTAFSILLVMLLVGIITVDDVVKILNLSPEAANAFRLIIERIQELTHNILDILSQLLDKIFGWAGVDVDLSKIKIDTNNTGSSGISPANNGGNNLFKK